MATRVPALIQLSDPRVAAQLVYTNERGCSRPIDLSHTSAILDLKRGSVGYTVVTTQLWIWVTVVFPECKSIYRGIYLTYLSFNQIPNQEKDTTLG